MGGTACISTLGMFAEGGGWGILLTLYTVTMLIGGISEKPLVINHEIKIGKVVNVTYTFDHDLIDGAKAAKFTTVMKSLIESGYGLKEFRD